MGLTDESSAIFFFHISTSLSTPFVRLRFILLIFSSTPLTIGLLLADDDDKELAFASLSLALEDEDEDEFLLLLRLSTLQMYG